MSSNSNNATTLAENKVLILYILNLINNDIRQDDLFKIINISSIYLEEDNTYGKKNENHGW